MEFLELEIAGRRYESAVIQWQGDQSRFLLKTYRQLSFTGWFGKSEIMGAMVKNDMAHRCCNIHGERLVVADGTGMTQEALAESQEKAKVHGKTFLKCPWPNCTVGLWSGSSSLPGDASLRKLRATVFGLLRSDGRLVADRAIKAGIVNEEGSATKPGGYIAIGCLNLSECELLLGLEGAEVLSDTDDSSLDMQAVRRSIIPVPRSIELD